MSPNGLTVLYSANDEDEEIGIATPKRNLLEQLLDSASPSITKSNRQRSPSSPLSPAAEMDCTLGSVLLEVQKVLLSEHSDALVSYYDKDFLLLVSDPGDSANVALGGKYWRDWGGSPHSRCSSLEALFQPMSRAIVPIVVKIPLYTTGRLSPFPEFKACGNPVHVSFRLVSSIYHVSMCCCLCA